MLDTPVRASTPIRRGQATDPADVAAAADLIAAGRTIAFLNRTVCALIGPADTRAFPDEVIRVKGEARRTRPVAAFTTAEEIAASVDTAKMPAALAPLLTDPASIRARLGGLLLMRMPITQEAAARTPPHLLSHRKDGTPIFMTADTAGYAPLDDLFAACRARGVHFLGGTSMNPSGTPEIVDQPGGIAFAVESGLPMFLADPAFAGWPAGSPSLVEVRQDELVLIRDGVVPIWVFERLLGLPIVAPPEVPPPRYGRVALDRAACEAMSPEALCAHVLAELDRQRGPMTAEARTAPAPVTAIGDLAGILPLFLVVFFGFLAVGLPTAALSLHVGGVLGFGAVLVGAVIGMQSVATVLSRHGGGVVSDEHGPRTAALIGLPLAALSGVLYLAAAVLPVGPTLALALLVAGRVAVGLGESLFITATLTWGIGRLGPGRAGKVIAWQGIGMFSAVALGAPAGLALLHAFGLAGVAVATALTPLVALAVALRTQGVEPVGAGGRVPFHQVVSVIWRPGAVLFLASVPFAALGAFLALAFAARDWAGAGLALFGFGAGYVGVRLFLAHLPDRHGGIPVAGASLAVLLAGQVLLWLAPGPLAAVAGATLTGMGYSLIFPCMGIEATRRLPASQRGRAVGNFLAFFDLALGVTAPTLGLVATGFGYPAIFAAGALGIVAALVLLPGVRRMGVVRA